MYFFYRSTVNLTSYYKKEIKVLPIKPNLVIAGVNKAGTTSLFSYLAKHPNVSGSNIKETCYFLPIRYGEALAPLSEYQSLFHYDKFSSIYMEATPGYFYGGIELIENIKHTLPEAKIVLLLRDPAKRLISFFNFMKSMLLIDQDMTLKSYIDHCRSLSSDELRDRANNPYFGVEGGYYNRYIGDWIEQFGERVKILFFEDMKDNPSLFLTELSGWLDLAPDFYTNYEFAIANKTSTYKNRQLHQLSIMANMRFEAIFRRYPVVKHFLKGVYLKLNTGSTLSVSQYESKMAQVLYLESNKELVNIISEAGISEVPYWLKGK